MDELTKIEHVNKMMSQFLQDALQLHRNWNWNSIEVLAGKKRAIRFLREHRDHLFQGFCEQQTIETLIVMFAVAKKWETWIIWEELQSRYGSWDEAELAEQLHEVLEIVPYSKRHEDARKLIEEHTCPECGFVGDQNAGEHGHFEQPSFDPYWGGDPGGWVCYQ
jgi:hypothetical protein